MSECCDHCRAYFHPAPCPLTNHTPCDECANPQPPQETPDAT